MFGMGDEVLGEWRMLREAGLAGDSSVIFVVGRDKGSYVKRLCHDGAEPRPAPSTSLVSRILPGE